MSSAKMTLLKMNLTDKQIEGIVDAVIDELDYEVDAYGMGDYSIQSYLPKEGLEKVKVYLMEVLKENGIQRDQAKQNGGIER